MHRSIRIVIAFAIIAFVAAQDCEQEKQQIQTLVSNCQQEKATLEASLTEARDLTQQWVDHSNNQEKQFQASSAELEQRIQQLQQEVAASKNELVLFKEQVASAQNSWLPLWLQIRVTDAVDKVKEFAVQVTTGQTDNELTLNLHKGYKSAAAAVHTGYVAVEPHLITAKAKLSELYAQVEPHIEKHITSAAWWKSLKAQGAQVEVELRTYITSTLKSVPSLAPYADPVSVQLLVYFMFAAPVLTLLLASCALRPRRERGSSYDKLPKTKLSQNGGKPRKKI